MAKRLVESTETPLIASIRPAIAELERLVEWAYARYGGDKPDGCSPVVVLIQTRGVKKKACGWFGAERWTTREGVLRHELTLTSEQLSRPVLDILSTTIHEVVHFYAFNEGIQDVSQGGRHNAEFREIAEQFGLLVESKGSAGCAATTLSPALADALEEDFRVDYTALDLFRLVTPSRPKATPKRNSWGCGCRVVMLAARQVLNAECRDCGGLFVKTSG